MSEFVTSHPPHTPTLFTFTNILFLYSIKINLNKIYKQKIKPMNYSRTDNNNNVSNAELKED